MNIPSVNNIPWQRDKLVLTLQDKQDGLMAIKLKLPARGQAQLIQCLFTVGLDEAQYVVNGALEYMISQPK